MAAIVKFSLIPRYIPSVGWGAEERHFLSKDALNPFVPYRYDPSEVPKQVSFNSAHKAIPDFVPINGRMGMSPEARDLIEEFEPEVHQFIPVEIRRPRSNKPIYRLDGRILDVPYYLFRAQVALDAVWIEKSKVHISPAFKTLPPRVTRLPGDYNIVLQKHIVQGHHAWQGGWQMWNDLFFSNALAREVEARDLRKLDIHYVEEA